MASALWEARGIGLAAESKVPFWAPWTLFFFVAFNLLCGQAYGTC